jgi:hypothetical protein
MPEEKRTFVVRNRPVATVETHEVVLSLTLTDEQKRVISAVTGKSPDKLDLTAIELNMIVDAVAYAHGHTVGASY